MKNCRHHWLIEAAAGPTSRAVCKFCGARTKFYNWQGVSLLVLRIEARSEIELAEGVTHDQQYQPV